METSNQKAPARTGLLIFLCWLVYTTAYIGRLNFSACKVNIISTFGSTKEEVGLIASFFFFAYGAGQLINGILSHKYNVRLAISGAMIVSAVINLLMTLTDSLVVMRVLWMVNGLAQSVLWSTLIHTLGERLPDDMLKKAMLIMSTTTALGTALAYGISALCVATVTWKWAFYVGAGCVAVVAVLWFLFLPKDEGRVSHEAVEETAEQTAKKKKTITMALLIEVIVMMGLCIVTNFLKDGLTEWTPSILTEKYKLGEALSIVLTLTLPLVAVSGAFFSVRLSKIIKGPVALCGTFFAIAVAAIGALLAILNSGAPWYVIMVDFIITVCAASAINQILTCMVPLEYRDRIDAGFMAGLSDTFCYVGSTCSTAILGSVADGASGWNGVFRLLLIVSVAAVALCAGYVVTRKVKKK